MTLSLDLRGESQEWKNNWSFCICNHYHYYLFSNRCFGQKDSWTNGQQYEQYGYKDKGIIWWYRTRDINQNRKNDRTLYTDDSLTTPLATINGGELAEFLSETKNAYQIKTNDGYTGYLALEDGTKVTKNIQTKPEELSDAVIVLDPGHGGNDTGALSNDEQTEEKDITLSTAIKVKRR